MAQLASILDQVNGVLALASEALDDLEAAVGHIELLRGVAAGQDVADIERAAVAELKSELDDAIAHINQAAPEVGGNVALLDAALQAVAEEIEEAAGGIREDLTRSIESIDDGSAALVNVIESMLSDVEENLESLSEKLIDEVDDLSERLGQGVDEATGTVTEVADEFVSMIEATTGAATRFVESVDGSIGKIVDALEDIEQVIEPVRPVLSAMEAVA
jgi:ABC-type transporter Mla subunit MlaD